MTLQVGKRKCTNKKVMELPSMTTEDKRLETEVDERRKQKYVRYKQNQSSNTNPLKDINVLQLILKQKDKHLHFLHKENCSLQDRLHKQSIAFLGEIKERDNKIENLICLHKKIEKFDKTQDMIKENIRIGLNVKLDTVIGQMEVMRSAIDELLVEARQKSNILSDTKNVTLNIIKPKGILQISTED